MARPYSISLTRRRMGNAIERSIEAVAWMERSLHDSVSSVYVDDVKIIAGDWNGRMVCWSRDGDTLWETNLNDRVSGIRLSIDGEMLWCIAGRVAVGIDYNDGGIKWNVEFDGSTDSIELDGKNRAWIISSVYDIELNDFIESAITLVDGLGNVVQQHILDERPWSIHPFAEGHAFFGLGRPRGGILEIIEDNKKLIVKHEALHDSPVLCGSNLAPFYLGHSNGMITEIDKDGQIGNLSLNCDIDSAVIDLDSDGELLFICLDNSDVFCIDRKGNKKDSVELLDSDGNPELVNVIDGKPSNYWIVTSTDNGGKLIDSNQNNGNSKITLKIIVNSRIRDIANSNGMTVIGLDNGKVISIEENMLSRRIIQSEGFDDEGDMRRSEMRDRLRKLRS